MGTRADLRNEAEARVQDEENVIASDARVNTWINNAIADISRSHMWPFLKVRTTKTLAKDTDTVDLDADCRILTKVMLVEDDGSRTPLTPVNDRWIQNNINPAVSGTPYYYTNGGYKQTAMNTAPVRVLRVGPKPDRQRTLEITYLRRGVKLTSDDHYAPFPDDFDECIVLYVMRQYYRQIEVESVVADHDKAYKEELARLKMEFGNEYYERFPRVMLDYDDYDYGEWNV